MNIYVLSLPDDHHRRKTLKSQFPRHFPNFQIVDAVDGRTSPPEASIPGCKKDRHRPLTNTEVACSLGHIKIYELILNRKISDFSAHLILEDDIIGDSSQLDLIETLFADLPEKSLVLLGGLHGMNRAQHLHGYLTPQPNVYRIPPSQLRNLSGTCCYLIDSPMAEHILEKQISCLHRADDWAELLKGEPNIYYAPILAHPPQNHSNSHIEQGRSHLYDGGILKRWYRDGWRESIARPLTRLFISILARRLRLYRIHSSQNNAQ